jgi:putative SOS response-associated peptidase YedK
LTVEYEPRYNVAPTTNVLAVVQEDEPVLTRLKWGLVPFWADDPKIGNRMINARAEGIAEKPAFRNAFRHHRCLIPLDGFYEWDKQQGEKIPYYFHLEDHRPFSLAGLWETWDKGSEPLRTCTVVTTEANPLMSNIHDRMPVILAPEDRDLWLDPDAESEALLGLLRPYEGEDLTAYRVSKRVNSPRFDGPECIEPVNSDEEGQTSLDLVAPAKTPNSA